MATSFKIPEKAYEGFLDLIDIGPEKLERLIGEASSSSLTLDLPSLTEKLAAAIEVPSERIERVIYRVLIPLNLLRADFDMSPSEFIRLLEGLIKRQNADWYKQHGEGWKRVVPIVEPLLAANGYFAQLNKTQQLLANRPSQAREFKILTELRPVYDDEVSAVKAMVLTSTLVVDYEEGGVLKCLHLTVDQADLAGLQKQLDRAEKKVQVLDQLADRLGVPVLIAGAD